MGVDRFLWKVLSEEKIRVFKWSGKNDYVALCEPEFLSFGGGCATFSQSHCSWLTLALCAW